MVEIMVKDTGKTYEVSELLKRTNHKYDELINHRIFESLKEAQRIFLQLNNNGTYSMEHSFVTPAGIEYGVNEIKNKETY